MTVTRDDDNVQGGRNTIATSSLSWNHTIGAGSNTFLGVFIKNFDQNSNTVSSVTFNGSSTGVSYITSHTQGPYFDGSLTALSDVEIWGGVGFSGVVSITANLTGSNLLVNGFICFSASYFGVDQTTPTESSQTGENGSVSSFTGGASTPTLAGSMLIGASVNSNAVTPTSNNSNTTVERDDTVFGINPNNRLCYLSSGTATLAASTGYAFSLNFGQTINGINMVNTILRPVAAASSPGGMGALIVARKARDAWKRRRRAGLWVPGDFEPVMA